MAEGTRAAGEVAAGPPVARPRARTGATRAAAVAVRDAFERHRARFDEVTRRAWRRFERRDWQGAQDDATERLALYHAHLGEALEAVRGIFGPALSYAAWARVRDHHAALVAGCADAELAATFFNSISRRLFPVVGLDPRIQYLDLPPVAPAPAGEPPIYDSYVAEREVDAALVRRLLGAFAWTVPYAQLGRDARLVAAAIEARVRPIAGPGGRVVLEVLRAPFFRNKGAYVVGRILAGGQTIPLVLPLLNAARGIVVDAVLMTSDEASVVFGFSWSYFRVDAPRPRELVEFLRSIMPLKRVDELYSSIGCNRHAKTEFYRGLVRCLEDPGARFAPAEGDEGMVMGVFTLPAFNVVFKVIKDTFEAPKNTTRRAVMDKYHFVFVRDRVGRLADAQEFELLEFPRRCFPEELLAYLLRVAGRTVVADGERVLFRHLYTERRVTPLNLFIRDAAPDAAREAILDYGNAIKDLAAANIFTGDMLLKNFGVTRNGRVICYDYDELCLLSDCRFRRIPPPRSYEDELAAEPWFSVGEQDVFPEEFHAFLVPAGDLRDAFLDAHGDLLRVEFWQGVQERLAAGEFVDVFPYRRNARLQRGA